VATLLDKKLNILLCQCDNQFFIKSIGFHYLNHWLSIIRPKKRGKEKSPSDRHYQCQKEMDDYLLACQQILEREPHSDTPCQ
jgi:hypothetical protein